MGSTTHIVDENGNVQNRYAYDAWGKIEVKEEAVLNRFTYYGQQIDPITQQYYLRARFYNPVIGRFTQEDTYRGDGLNLYAYCANNPVYYVDPSGFDKDALGNTSLVPYDPHFASEQRMWDGEIYFDSKTNRWKEWGAINLLQPRLVKWVALIFRQGAQQPLLIVLLSLLECRHLRLEIIYIMIL